MLVDLVAVGGAAGAILNHGSGGAPLLLMVLMVGGGGSYREILRSGGALGDRIKCRGEIHGISHLPVRGRRASLAPVRLTLVGELCMLRAQLGRWGLGHDQIRE